MNAIEKRYGTVLRVYDNNGRSFDQFTIIPPRWAKEYVNRDRSFSAIGSSQDPFHPMGFGMHVDATPGPHLGKRIQWNDLPEKVKSFARQSFPEYCPKQ